VPDPDTTGYWTDLDNRPGHDDQFGELLREFRKEGTVPNLVPVSR
jgi:hypothetical protein